VEFSRWNQESGDSDRFRTRLTRFGPEALGAGRYGVYMPQLRSEPTPVFESLEEANEHADAEIARLGGPAVPAAWAAVVDYQTGHTWELPPGAGRREHRPGPRDRCRYALYWPGLAETAPSYPTWQAARTEARERLSAVLCWRGGGWDVSDGWVAIVDWETGETEEHRVEQIDMEGH
jgi:hypothetical protein